MPTPNNLIENPVAEPFGTFLAALADEGGPVGDLASDFVRDCRFSRFKPSDYKTAAAVKARMVGMGACTEALDALGEVCRQYEATATP